MSEEVDKTKTETENGIPETSTQRRKNAMAQVIQNKRLPSHLLKIAPNLVLTLK